jgi:hypothetical protein
LRLETSVFLIAILCCFPQVAIIQKRYLAKFGDIQNMKVEKKFCTPIHFIWKAVVAIFDNFFTNFIFGPFFPLEKKKKNKKTRNL